MGGTLTVEGELRLETPEGAAILHQEFGPSRFRRTVQLPDAIDAARVEATYHNGVLLIGVPKAQEAKPRTIKVQVQGPTELPVPTDASGGMESEAGRASGQGRAKRATSEPGT